MDGQAETPAKFPKNAPNRGRWGAVWALWVVPILSGPALLAQSPPRSSPSFPVPPALPPVRVESAAEAKRTEAPIPRYDSEQAQTQGPWDELPSWRKAEFFGVRAEGQLFVFVLDRSGSMESGTRMIRAKSELNKSVMSLHIPQQFQVIFFNEEPWLLSRRGPLTADTSGKAKLRQFLPMVQPDGTTEPSAAIQEALSYQPDAIFLLSDGAFPPSETQAILQSQSVSTTYRPLGPQSFNATPKATNNPAPANPAPAMTEGSRRKLIPIHCIDLSNGTAGPDLQRIARKTGGHYVKR